MEENLNIEFNKRLLITKALKKYKTQKEACVALCCESRYLINKIKEMKKDVPEDKIIKEIKNESL